MNHLRPGAGCDECENALMGSDGVFCQAFNCKVWDESVAEDCDSYILNPSQLLPTPHRLRVPTQEEARAYLQSLHISLWGEAIRMNSDGLDKASKQIVDLVKAISEFTQEKASV